jgi:hypothetical protein
VVRRNTIQKNEYEAVWIYEGGQGEIVDNDLRENTLGAIDVDEASKPNVKIDGNNTGVENASG